MDHTNASIKIEYGIYVYMWQMGVCVCVCVCNWIYMLHICVIRELKWITPLETSIFRLLELVILHLKIKAYFANKLEKSEWILS